MYNILELWDPMKAVLRGEFIALNASIKKLEESHSGNLIGYLNTLEQKEANTLMQNQWQEINKWRGEINKLETKEKNQ